VVKLAESVRGWPVTVVPSAGAAILMVGVTTGGAGGGGVGPTLGDPPHPSRMRQTEKVKPYKMRFTVFSWGIPLIQYGTQRREEILACS
jgi:hypothetical protein